MAEITSEKVDHCIEMMRVNGNGHGEAPKTRTLNKAVLALKTLLSWARKNGRIKTNPIADKPRVGKPDKSERVLKPDEAERLLATSPEPEHTIWLCFLTTGLRKGELINLRWPSVCFATDTIRVEAATSKSRQRRDIPMAPDLRKRLLDLRDESADSEGFVFTTTSRGTPWVNNLPRKLRQALKRAGLAGDAVSLHGLRHTFATTLLLGGANVIAVSKLLGHATVTLTLNTYAHALPDNLRAAIGHLPYGGTQEGHWQGTERIAHPQSKVG